LSQEKLVQSVKLTTDFYQFIANVLLTEPCYPQQFPLKTAFFFSQPQPTSRPTGNGKKCSAQGLVEQEEQEPQLHKLMVSPNHMQ